MTSRNFLFSGGRERQICRERKSVVTMAAGGKSTRYYSPSFVSQACDLLKIQIWSYAPGLKLSKSSLLLLGWYPRYGVNSCMAVLACLYSSCMNSLAVWNDSYPTYINHPLFCHLMDQPIAPTISWVVFGVGEKLVTVLMKLRINYLQFPPSLPCSRTYSDKPTDIRLIKCQQRAMHHAWHRGGRQRWVNKPNHLLSPYIPNSTATVSSLNTQFSKFEYCSFHVQLKHVVLLERFSVFPSGTSKSPLWAPFARSACFSLCRLCLRTPQMPVVAQTLISFNTEMLSDLVLCDVWHGLGTQQMC